MMPSSAIPSASITELTDFNLDLLPPLQIGDRARPGKCIKGCGRCDLIRNTGAEKQQFDRKF